MSSPRVLSYSEVSTALDCQARWDFRYGDQLAGSSLKEKTVTPLLSGGRAWGAAVAAWHSHVGQLDASELALNAMNESLEADAEAMREYGVFDQDEFRQLKVELLQILIHYCETTEPTRVDLEVERELLVSIPSRSGQRASNRYKLLCYLDATETDDDGRVWIHEYKLRGTLTPASLIVTSRQIRWYAWALWQATGQKPAGVWMNERLRLAPKPARVLKSGRVSHAVDQATTVASYEAACSEHDDTPHDNVLDALRQRKWQQSVRVAFRDSELEEIGRELVSAAKWIHLLESHELEPLRNVKRANCGWCPYRDVCPAPDNELIDALFERRPPKHLRDPVTERSSP